MIHFWMSLTITGKNGKKPVVAEREYPLSSLLARFKDEQNFTSSTVLIILRTFFFFFFTSEPNSGHELHPFVSAS